MFIFNFWIVFSWLCWLPPFGTDRIMDLYSRCCILTKGQIFYRVSTSDLPARWRRKMLCTTLKLLERCCGPTFKHLTMAVFPHQLLPSDLVSAVLLYALPLSIFASRLYHSKIRDYLKQVHYPPSPPSLPLFGHALSLPLSHSHIAMAEWYKTYGEIILISLLGSPIVILSTLSAARELMEKKGANFSGRPRMTFLREWWVSACPPVTGKGLRFFFAYRIGWKNALAFIPYGEQQRKQRRLIHPHMTPSAITAHHSTLCSETQRFIIQLKENPDAFTEHIHECVSVSPWSEFGVSDFPLVVSYQEPLLCLLMVTSSHHRMTQRDSW